MYVGATAADYRYGSGVIHFGRFYCDGNESNLTSCSHAVAQMYCTHGDDVGVICRGTVIRTPNLLSMRPSLLCTLKVKQCYVVWYNKAMLLPMLYYNWPEPCRQHVK